MSSCGAQPREMRDIGYGKIDRSAKVFLAALSHDDVSFRFTIERKKRGSLVEARLSYSQTHHVAERGVVESLITSHSKERMPLRYSQGNQ